MRLSCILLIFFLYSSSAFCSDSLFVSSIKISGNHKTKDWIITREILFHPNAWVKVKDTSTLATQSRFQLNRTALFNKIKLNEIVSGDSLTVLVDLTERWYIIPKATFNIADRNFNSWLENPSLYRTTYGGGLDFNNFRGRNELISFNFILGWRKGIDFIYSAPFINKAKTLGFFINPIFVTGHELGIFTMKDKLVYFRYDPKKIVSYFSTTTGIILRRAYFTQHKFQINFSSVSVSDTVVRYNHDYLPKDLQTCMFFNPSYELRIDKRDAITYPLNGYLIKTTLGYIFPLNGIFKPFPQLALATHYFHALPYNFNLAVGLSGEWQPYREYPYFFRRHLGYDITVRGYEHYLTDANALLLTRVELRNRILQKNLRLAFLPFEQFRNAPIQVYAKLFYDAGYSQYPIYEFENTLSNRWLKGWGAGIDLVTYYDKSMRIEYSFNQLGQSELFLHFDEAF